MLFCSFLLGSVPLLPDGDWIRGQLCVPWDPVVFHWGKEGDVEYVVDFIGRGDLNSVRKRSQSFKYLQWSDPFPIQLGQGSVC
jgi:hypothetical protein